MVVSQLEPAWRFSPQQEVPEGVREKRRRRESQKDQFLRLVRTLGDLHKSGLREFSKEDITQVCAEAGMDFLRFEEVMGKLREEGFLLLTQEGLFKFVPTDIE